ncbi:MAG TPA: biosynthetic peptidoglycan transglycosylase [Burkholderiaceae bacterium]|nr:biosynthetic peptidoglycan transglycosylase [Burkholderiaceae bacterium]
MKSKRLSSALLHCTLGLGVGILIAAAALVTAATVAGVFDTRPGTWTTTFAPFARLPSLAITLNVPGMLRLALAPAGQRLLDGSSKSTSIGRLEFRRHDRTLIVVCNPCRLEDARLALQPLALPLELRLTPRDDGDLDARIDGVLNAQGVLVSFTARSTPERIDLEWSLPRTDLAALVRVFAAAIPEAQDAQIEGTLSSSGTLTLPGLRANSTLQLADLHVSGLGTEALAEAAFQQRCTDPDGAPRRVVNGPGSRLWMPLEDIGDRLPAAVLAAEDQRFFEHPGYDTAEIAASLSLAEPAHPSAGAPPRQLRGASTLTQQVARTLFTGGERTAVRKLRELLYAVEMERTLGKQRILELYLNSVDWGPGVCGARVAARTYFGKAPARLSALEAAWLAASLHQPQRAYEREFLTGRADLERTHRVLAQMRSLASGERARAARQSLVFARAPRQTPIAASAAAGAAP